MIVALFEKVSEKTPFLFIKCCFRGARQRISKTAVHLCKYNENFHVYKKNHLHPHFNFFILLIKSFNPIQDEKNSIPDSGNSSVF